MKQQADKPQKSKSTLKWFIGNLVKVIIIAAAVVGLSVISKIPKKEQDTSVSEPVPVNVKVLKVTTEPEFDDVLLMGKWLSPMTNMVFV